MTSASRRIAFIVGALLGLFSVPVRAVVAVSGRILPAQRGSALVRSEAPLIEVGGASGDSCASSLTTEPLRRARAAWVGKHLKALSTVEIPRDNATMTYAVRGGQLYRNGKLGKDKTFKSSEYADDNVFIEALIWKTLRRFPHVPDADLVLSYGDVETRQSAAITAPVFAFSAMRGQPEDAKAEPQSRPVVIGFPNPYLIDQALTLSERRAGNTVPWAAKRARAYWRGTLTAGNSITNEAMVAQQGRVRLAKIAAGRPLDFDVAFTDIDLKDTWSPPVKQEMFRAYRSATHSSVADFFTTLPQYKYLVNVDGVSVAWRGLALLSSGSVMLLQASDRGEFFSEDMQPWVHYVPLKRDLSDLLQTLDYLRANDQLASRIAQAGQDFADSSLTFPGLECYVLDALKFMSEVVEPLPLPELSGLYGFEAVPEPDAHLRTSPPVRTQ